MMRRVNPLEHGLSMEPSPELTGALPDEEKTHSFIVKVWLEKTAEAAGAARWRGYVTHVASGRRMYVERLDEICLFVAPFLEDLKLRLGRRWKIWRFFFRVHK
jgi:hypothetical protein